MKRLTAALCALCLLLCAGCGSGKAQSGNGSSNGGANPFVDYATLAEAEQAAGFTLTAPGSVDGFVNGDRATIHEVNAKAVQSIVMVIVLVIIIALQLRIYYLLASTVLNIFSGIGDALYQLLFVS